MNLADPRFSWKAKTASAPRNRLRNAVMFFGLLLGIALVALMLLSVTLLVVETPLSRLAGSYGAGLEFTGFAPSFLLAMLSTGAILGVAGALMAAHQRLHDLEVL